MRYIIVVMVLVSGIFYHLPAADLEYAVKAGDTLSEISLQFTGTFRNYLKIASYNSISDPNLIISGSSILIQENILKDKTLASVSRQQASTDSAAAGETARLSKDNLDDMAGSIMDKIEKMREERRQRYVSRELIDSSVVTTDKTVDEDQPVPLEWKFVTESDSREKDEYIVRLKEQKKPEAVKPIHAITGRKHAFVAGGQFVFNHAPKGDAMLGLDRKSVASGLCRWSFDRNQWIGFSGMNWEDSPATGYSLEYDKFTVFYRHDFDQRQRSNWFVEGGLAFYRSEYRYLLNNKNQVLDDDGLGFDAGVGYERYLSSHLSAELYLKTQVAEAEYIAANNAALDQSFNDTYAGIGLNWYF
ncbi:MAG: LysM domain-containing protein [Candidatus Wallbacteria bacterium]|nr:LysM domain-containing protein [Candidatus Wallbacteria bacterium]